MLNLSVLLEQCAAQNPARPAFSFMDTTLSFAQVNQAASQVAGALGKCGIQPGDKVALGCPNLLQFPIIYFGILKAGAVVVPFNVLLKKDEIVYQLRDCEAKAYFCFAGSPELPMAEMGYAAFNEVPGCEHFFIIMPKPGMPSSIEGLTTFDELVKNEPVHYGTVQCRADDTCVIIYTSGTTGNPKGAELTHANLLMNAIVCSGFLEITPEDTGLTVLPLFHIFGMTVMMNAGLYKGCANVLLPRFDAAMVFDTMKQHNITWFSGVPTMYWALLHHAAGNTACVDIARKLRLCVSGGASLPVKVLEDFEQQFGVPVIEGYGMSEGSPAVTFNQPKTGRKPGSIGTPVWGVEVKLVDKNGSEVATGEKGELLYRGHNVMKSYYKKTSETAKTLRNGWLHSGDIAIKDEDGFYFIVDRVKDMIIRGGMNVYPREVEETMMKHEAVSMVAVIGIPHEELGEEIKAFVVLKEGQTVTGEELVAWTKERLAAYKYPRHIELVQSLPMNATGKIMKKELRKRVQETA